MRGELATARLSDVLALRVAIGMLRALEALPIRLQAVAQVGLGGDAVCSRFRATLPQVRLQYRRIDTARIGFQHIQRHVAAGDLSTTSFNGEDTVRYEGWTVAAGAGVGVFFASLAFATFAVFLRPLADEFAWSREAVSRAFGGMTLGPGAALSAPFVGRLVDRIGTTKVCGLCLLACGGTFASLALLTAHLWHLYATFAVVGLAMTGTSAVVYARVITSWFDRRRGVALAVVMASAAVGSIAHPPMASALIALVGWRTAYLLLGLAGVAVGVPIV